MHTNIVDCRHSKGVNSYAPKYMRIVPVGCTGRLARAPLEIW